RGNPVGASCVCISPVTVPPRGGFAIGTILPMLHPHNMTVLPSITAFSYASYARRVSGAAHASSASAVLAASAAGPRGAHPVAASGGQEPQPGRGGAVDLV